MLACAVPALAISGCGGSGARGRTAAHASHPAAAPVRGPLRASVSRAGELPTARQDAASAPDGRGAVLVIGGLDPEESSLADVLQLRGGGVRRIGTLPTPLHDACAGAARGSVYLFGGGEQESFSGILRVTAAGAAAQVGSLPTPASDVACVAAGGAVYVIGGYTGQAPLRSILAWRPGGAPRVAGTLPKPLRYAAAAAVRGQILIAGGTSGEAASSAVYSFDPATGGVRTVARLPAGLTHAAGVAAGGVLLVIGGRGAREGTQRSSILAVSSSGTVSVVGRLPRPLSDLSAVADGAGALLIGGRDAGGQPQRTILRLRVSR